MPAPRAPAKPRSRYGAGRTTGTTRTALLDLPASGTDLPAPKMPAGRAWTLAERHRWSELWSSPQAVAWDESCIGTVAILVCYETAVFDGTASAWQAAELRHAGEALGLTPRALSMLGWRIVS